MTSPVSDNRNFWPLAVALACAAFWIAVIWWAL